MKKHIAYIFLILLVLSIILFGKFTNDICLENKKTNINIDENYNKKIYNEEIFSEKELIATAFLEASKIIDGQNTIHIETAQYILYANEKCCDVEFPIDNSDYYILVTFIRNSKSNNWELNEVKKITNNQSLD